MRAAARDRLRAGDSSDEAPHVPAGQAVEDGFVVRRVAGNAPGRAYRCPGCDQELDGGTPHVVAWPDGDSDDRRHWHTACWGARSRRGVKVHRSKNAPRYG